MSQPRDRFPPQIKFIIGNEACERFSFYGMKNILTFFMINYLLTALPAPERTAQGEATYHLFVTAAYFFPLLGGYLSDRFLGKYRTIFYVSILYSLGQLCLALFVGNATGFYVGLALVALGTGGIKPCVSSLVGDQFTESNKHLVKRVFALFYWIINFGSFFASLTIPKVLEWYGPRIAFGIPGALMAISTIVLWAGRRQYVDLPPTGRNPHSFMRIVTDALRAEKTTGIHWLDRALAKHPAEAVEGAKAVLRVVLLCAPIPFFWALWDQKGSSWVVQATGMNRHIGPWEMAPSQMLVLNPLLVMLIIPFSEYVLYPAIERLGIRVTHLRRMGTGMFIAGISFATVGLIQVALDSNQSLSILWQSIPYLLLTLSEVLVSTTGLEFAYSQAPVSMKGTLMSFWLLTTSVGNLFTAWVSELNVWKGAAQFFFFAALIFGAGIVFAFLARWYVPRDWFVRDLPSKAEAEALPAADPA